MNKYLANPKYKHPQGMVLAYTLVILVLIAMMGTVLISSSSTELSISGNNRLGREAFNIADTSERIATLMARIIVHPELGPPTDALTSSTDPTKPFVVEIDSTRFTLANLQEESAHFDFLERYLEAIHDDPLHPPHIVFKVNDKVVATAVITMEIKEPIANGFGLGVNDKYDFSSGSGVQLNLAVTITALPVSTDSGPGDPRSIITSIYRELL
jgi:hypothetical protein